jgi:hypothetical protein
MGNPGDSVGVVTAWQWPDALAGITGAHFESVAAIRLLGQAAVDTARSMCGRAWTYSSLADPLAEPLFEFTGLARPRASAATTVPCHDTRAIGTHGVVRQCHFGRGSQYHPGRSELRRGRAYCIYRSNYLIERG